MKRYLGLAAAALLLGACSADSTPESSSADLRNGACTVDVPRTQPLEVFVQPDVGSQPFVDAILRAHTSIDVMIYQMGNGTIVDKLVEKANAGVAVRVIFAGDEKQRALNTKASERLAAAKATFVWSDPRFTFMHAKLIIVDDAEAVLSTGNFPDSQMARERNLAVRDTDPADLAVLGQLFDADFARQEPDLSCTRLLVAPVNARQRLLDFIAKAERSLLVHSMQLADPDVRAALAARKAAGVDVRVLLADPDWIEANASAGAFLAEHAITARWAEHVHVKAIVVDGRAAYVGSINLSRNSITRNREVGLIVDESSNVATIVATFEKDWAGATPF